MMLPPQIRAFAALFSEVAKMSSVGFLSLDRRSFGTFSHLTVPCAFSKHWAVTHATSSLFSPRRRNRASFATNIS